MYGPFMVDMSNTFFRWCEEDVALLREATWNELERKCEASEASVDGAITKEAYQLYCKRKTRGTEQTTEKLDELILSTVELPEAMRWASPCWTQRGCRQHGISGRSMLHASRTWPECRCTVRPGRQQEEFLSLSLYHSCQQEMLKRERRFSLFFL